MGRMGRAAVFIGPGQPLELREFAVPDPVGGEVLVRVTGCTICGSDVHTFEGRRTVHTPIILGHEIVGRIESLGPNAPTHDANGHALQPGDRVTWSIVANCGRCFFCDRHLPQKCERMVKYGHETVHNNAELKGGLADYCRLAPGSTLLRLPDALTDAVACPASCATATVAAALRFAGGVAGGTVLVQGAGMLGLTACAMARWAGAAEVICCDPAANRLERATAFGAGTVVLPQDLSTSLSRVTNGYGVDVALELSGSPIALEAGLPLLRIGGTYILVGAVFPTRSVALEPEKVVRRQLTIRGVHNYAPQDLATAVQFLSEAKAYPFESLVPNWTNLREVNRAFEQARRPEVFRAGVETSM